MLVIEINYNLNIFINLYDQVKISLNFPYEEM